jgi:hypothetical protein
MAINIMLLLAVSKIIRLKKTITGNIFSMYGKYNEQANNMYNLQGLFKKCSTNVQLENADF